MNKEQAKQALLELYEQQIIDLTVMSKIELGDDVINEIKRLKAIIYLLGEIEKSKNEVMNNEQQDLLDEAYRNYLIEDTKILPNMSKEKMTELGYRLTYDEFIKKIKTDDEFAKKWGLKIEERELSHDERFRIAYKNLELRKKLEVQSKMLHYPDGHNKVMDDTNIPTKLITITYNDKTIESYE
jgi:hypothetical protein